MRKLIAALAVLAIAGPAHAQDPKSAPKPSAPAQAPANADVPQQLHTLGVAVAKSLEPYALSPAELDQVVKGIREGASGKATVQLDVAAQGQIRDLAIARRQAAAQKESAPKADPKQVYILGVAVAKGLEPYALSAPEIEQVIKGIREGASGKTTVQLDTAAQERLQALAMARQEAAAKNETERGSAHLAKAAKEKGAQKTASGLVFIPVKEGQGQSPGANDTVKVHYTGRFPDGTVFDSSVARGEPATFPLNGVIPCWTEGVQKMKPGGKAKLVCPAEIAYGAQGRPPRIPGNAVLEFDVELLEVVTTPPAQPGGK